MVEMQGAKEMGSEDTIAQVHPKELTEALMREAIKAGCTLKIGVVDGIRFEGEEKAKKVTGVSVDGEMLDADKVGSQEADLKTPLAGIDD